MTIDYNYAYINLVNSWNISVQKLKEHNFENEAEMLDSFHFTNDCFQRLNSVLENLENIRDTESIKFQRELLITLVILERTKYDFIFLYEDLKKKLHYLFEAENSNISELAIFLSENNSCVVDILTDIGLKLSYKLLRQNKFDKLELVFKYYPSIPEKLEFLKSFITEQNKTAVDLLLQYFAKEEALSILGSKEYYSSSKEIIDTLTSFLSESSSKILAEFYKAMFLYNRSEFDDAIPLFQNVMKSETDNRTKQIAHLYKAYCLKILKQKEKAISEYKSILNSEIDEYYDSTSSIKQHAKKDLDALNDITGKGKNIDGILESWEKETILSISDEDRSKVLSILSNLKNHINDSEILTQYVKEFIDTMCKFRFINLKEKLSQAVKLAIEFNDLPELELAELKLEDKEKLGNYYSEVSKIDEMIKQIGDITEGLTIEDYNL